MFWFQEDAYLCGLCLPCLSLSRIHCQTFWERSVASRGRSGEDTPSSVALTGRLDKVLQRLKGERRAHLDQNQLCHRENLRNLVLQATVQCRLTADGITARRLHLRRGEVRIVCTPWRAEALHTLSRLCLYLLLGLRSSVVMVDVVMVDVLCGRPACHQNFGGPGIRIKEGPLTRRHHGARPIWGAWARWVPNYTWWLAARCLQDTG